MKTGIKVGDAMTKSPIFIKASDNIKKCAETMLKNKVGSCLIVENNILKGIITEKDLVDKVLAKNLDPVKTKVTEIMNKKLITIDPSKDIYDALVKMQKEDVRRLPIVSDDKLIGLLTEKDILRIEPELFDLWVEKLELREPKEKLSMIRSYKEGECENCSSYGPLFKVEGKLICEACK